MNKRQYNILNFWTTVWFLGMVLTIVLKNYIAAAAFLSAIVVAAWLANDLYLKNRNRS